MSTIKARLPWPSVSAGGSGFWSAAWTDSMLVPLIGTAIAAALIISRDSGALFHAQFYAEDGRFYYQDSYNLGVGWSLLRPQAGYFQEFSVLSAWVARDFFPLRDGPFVMALLGLLANVLPVWLLLSRRVRTVLPDLRVRIALAVVVICVPTDPSLQMTTVNAQWSLVIAALIVLLRQPPSTRVEHAIDAAILLISALTGPFAVVLAVVAGVRWWVTGRNSVPRAWVAGLAAIALLQILALEVISKHVSGSAIEARPAPALGATAHLFATLVGGRLLIGSVFGEANGLQAPLALQWIVLVGAIVVIAAIAWRGRRRFELLALLALGGAVLAGSLADPSTGSPAWPTLALVPVNAQRYFFLGQVGVLTALVWVVATQRSVIVRLGAGGLATWAIVLILAGHWSLPGQASEQWARQAAAFGRAPRGAMFNFVITPPPWDMILKKD